MFYESTYLEHHGIKGQKWGQRRFQNDDGSYTPEGRERYRKSSGSSKKSGDATSAVKKVGKAMDKLRKDSVKDGPKKTISRLPGTDFSKNRKKDPLEKMDEVFRVPTKRGPMRGMGLKTNGVYDREDGTKDTDRLKKDAKKDAEDMARAKAYYGEGAGNRRKQIRNRISERMKDPDYKAEYEKQLAAQDMSKHQKAANRERHAQDAKNTVAKTARGIKNLIMGVGSASLTAVALYNAAKLVGADKVIADAGKQLLNKIRR